MTVAEIITGYVQVCGRFGLRLEVSDGVLYVHNASSRLGYIMQGMNRAGFGGEFDNAYGLLRDISRQHGLKFDFKTPGEFLAYTDAEFGIVCLPRYVELQWVGTL